jgi:hypothetical protein
MSRIGLTFVLLMISFSAYAQQCGFENYGVITVKVHEQETGAFIHGLQLSLVYGDGEPIKTTANGHDDGILCEEPYLFWENYGDNIPKQVCKFTTLHRTKLEGLGDAYICIAPLQEDVYELNSLMGFNTKKLFAKTNEKLSAALQWHVQIKDANKNNKDVRFKTTLIPLPLHAPINICFNHLQSAIYAGTSSVQQKIIQVSATKDGQFKHKVDMQQCEQYIFVPYYTNPTFSNIHYPDYKPKLEKLAVISDSNMQGIQNDLPLENSRKYYSKGRIEWLNWNNDRIKSNRVFRIPADYKYPNDNGKYMHLYYSFNKSKGLYELDTLLNNKDYIKYNDYNLNVIGIDEILSDNEIKLNIYHLKNAQWQFIKEEITTREGIVKQPLKNDSTEIKEAILTCTRAERNNGMLYQIGQKHELEIVDTFWIKNIGGASTIFKLEYTNHFFVAAQNEKKASINAGDSIAIVYKRTHKPSIINNWLEHNKQIPGLQFFDDYGTINYAEKSLQLSKSYIVDIDYTLPVISETINGIKEEQYVIANFDNSKLLDTTARLHYCILTDSSGLLVAYGKKIGFAKIGEWRKIVRNDKGKVVKYDIEQYDKLLTLSLYNDTIGNCNISTLKLWSIGDFEVSKKDATSLTIGIPFNTVDITITNNKGSVKQSINYTELKEIDELKLYLLKENQLYYHQSNLKIPLDTCNEIFSIIWEPQFYYATDMSKPINTKTHIPIHRNEVLEKYFNEYKKKYPTLKYIIDYDTASRQSKMDFEPRPKSIHFILDLSTCTDVERAAIKERISKDENILHLSRQMQCGSYAKANGTIHIQTSVFSHKLPDDFFKMANSLGFDTKLITGGWQSNYHTITYKSQLLDDEFYKNYNKLCEAFRSFLFYLEIGQ